MHEGLGDESGPVGPEGLDADSRVSTRDRLPLDRDTGTRLVFQQRAAAVGLAVDEEFCGRDTSRKLCADPDGDILRLAEKALDGKLKAVAADIEGKESFAKPSGFCRGGDFTTEPDIQSSFLADLPSGKAERAVRGGPFDFWGCAKETFEPER